MDQKFWSKDKERKWRASFTRENVEGARLLAYNLRHSTPEAIVRAEKAQHLAREAKEDMEVRRLSKEAFLDGLPKIQVATDSDICATYKAKAGTKSVLIYSGNRKIVQEFDDIGNLVKETEVLIQ